VAYINEEIDASMSGTRVKSGDILLNVTGASIGRTCLVPKDFPSANVNQHVCIIRLKSEKNRDYVSWYLKSNFSKTLINVYQNGAGREGLNFEQIANITVAIPLETDEIDKVVMYISKETAKIDALITETQNSIALLKEHRTALISAAITGKIDVREAA
jgi:type I restriction enzyme S subunit